MYSDQKARIADNKTKLLNFGILEARHLLVMNYETRCMYSFYETLRRLTSRA